MSTLANRHNNYATVPLSESDNDDDNEQNSSDSQQNESMMNKVKDVVSKFLHPSFLFSANGEATRPKRKRSIEENGVEETIEPTTNSRSTGSKLKNHRSPTAENEPQLTDDDEDSINTKNRREIVPIESNPTEIEQQKKRRRTANYQHIISTTKANGHHEEEEKQRTSPPSKIVTNGVGSFANRRISDNESTKTNETTMLSNEENTRLTSTKQRFNISSNTRPLIANYDPSQSPLFSLNSRKPNESIMTPNRTTTNLKSNTNEFSSNYLLAAGLADRSQTNIHNTSQSSTLSNRLLSNERQVLGLNYSSINSRRLPYIERLRRRTLQDCIRLNRTLDSEPLSISTIEEHTSAVASPVRKPVETQEKECGIQCNISTTDSSMEPSKKIQRTFPPPDIRNEALSVPILEKTQTTSQTDSNIQTNSSITIEPFQSNGDITKPRVIGNITSFSWPKFARAQEEFAKKYPEKCRIDAIPTQPSKSSIIPIPIEKSNTTTTNTITKAPIFSMSPPRPAKPPAGPIWKCPSCSMEHPAQTASCSLCHGINPNYKRLSAIEPTPISSSSITKTKETIVEESVVSKAPTSFTSPSTIVVANVSVESVTTAASFSAPVSFPTFGTISTSTSKENVTVSFGSTTATTAPLFGATTSDKPVTSTPISLFPAGTSTPSTFPAFDALPTTTSSTSLSLTATTTTAASTTPTFGSFGSTPLSTSTSTTTSSEKPALFAFGSNSSTSSLAPAPSTTISAATTASTTPNLFAFSSTTTASSTTTSSLSFPTAVAAATTIATGGFSFSSTIPTSSTSTSLPIATTSASTSSSGFSFPSATTTTTASNSTPFTFGASSPPKPFAPSVVSTSATTTSTPAFGAASTFGAAPSTTADKPATSIPSFSAFGAPSTSSSSLFTFGASSNPSSTSTSGFAFSAPASSTSTTPSSGFGFAAPASSAPTSTSGFAFSAPTTSAAPFGSTGGFSFNASTSTAPPPAAAAPAFGAVPSTFAFGSTPSFSFGGGSTAPSTSSAPFQFTGAQATPATAPINSSFSVGFPPVGGTAAENNPFSVSEDSSNKRPVIKAKRRAKP